MSSSGSTSFSAMQYSRPDFHTARSHTHQLLYIWKHLLFLLGHQGSEAICDHLVFVTRAVQKHLLTRFPHEYIPEPVVGWIMVTLWEQQWMDVSRLLCIRHHVEDRRGVEVMPWVSTSMRYKTSSHIGYKKAELWRENAIYECIRLQVTTHFDSARYNIYTPPMGRNFRSLTGPYGVWRRKGVRKGPLDLRPVKTLFARGFFLHR